MRVVQVENGCFGDRKPGTSIIVNIVPDQFSWKYFVVPFWEDFIILLLGVIHAHFLEMTDH